MAYEVPTGEPSEITSGDLVSWLIPENPDFLIANSWVLTYAFVRSGSQITITTTDNGDNNHLATITAADSATLTAGVYIWQSYLTNGLERYLQDTGSFKVTANFATLSSGHDGRTHWQVTLDNIEAVIQGRATKDQSSYTISGRQLSRTPIADLIMLYDKAKSNVASEKRAEAISKGLGHTGIIRVRF